MLSKEYYYFSHINLFKHIFFMLVNTYCTFLLVFVFT